MRARTLVVLALITACGGATPKGADAPAQAAVTDPHASIGDLAAREGGLIGGANASAADGASGSFKADQVEAASPVKLDGALREWPARAAARTVITGAASSGGFAAALQYDDTRLYFAGEVTSSAALQRTARFTDEEDHAGLVLAFPSAAGFAAVEIAFFAGKPGETEGRVRYASGPQRGRDVPGAKIVEAPSDKGYAFEAQVPWAAIPEARTTRVGMRGAARYYDAQGASKVKSVVATSAGDAQHPGELAALPNEAEQSLIENLLAQRGMLATTPSIDVYADINGDGMKERISVYDHTLTITGSSYRHGREFFYRDLSGDLIRLDARDITGRSRDDLLLRRRFSMGADREILEVWSFFGDEPTTTFSHELAVTGGEKKLVNTARITGREIEIRYEPAKNWDAASYAEPTNADVEPVLLPWGAIESQVYRFDGRRFVKAREVAQKPSPGPATAPAPAPLQEPKTPVVRASSELSKALLDRYRADHGVASDAKPKVDLEVDLGGDARAERVALFGRDLVVFGPGFKGGNAYSFLTLAQFSDGADVLEVTARDLTGDGAAELVVRGVRHVPAAGRGVVEMDVLFVYQLRSDALSRVFSIETGRAQGPRRVQGLVQFVPSADGKRFEVDARPGRATGWTDKSYPWAQDKPGEGTIEPLLLPWGGVARARYAFSGSAFTLVP